MLYTYTIYTYIIIILYLFINVPQFSSSLPSSQSLMLSHLPELGTQRPFEHTNCDLVHVCAHVSNCSSAPSEQSGLPSQIQREETQRAAATQWKEPPVQFKQEISSLPSPQSSTPSQRRFRGTHLPLSHTNCSMLHSGKPAKDESKNSCLVLRDSKNGEGHRLSIRNKLHEALLCYFAL